MIDYNHFGCVIHCRSPYTDLSRRESLVFWESKTIRDDSYPSGPLLLVSKSKEHQDVKGRKEGKDSGLGV